MFARCLAVVAAAVLAAGAALAQSANVSPSRPAPPDFKARLDAEPLRFEIVRSAAKGCAPRCPEWIAIQGNITLGSGAAFRSFLQRLGPRRLPVAIASKGGSVDDAYEIGRAIRARGLPVAVARTDAAASTGADGVRLATVRSQGAVCGSSCVFILAGGTERHVGAGALVGVHQFAAFMTETRVLQRYRLRYEPGASLPTKEIVSAQKLSERTFETRTPEAMYRRAAAYFDEMGIDAAIMAPLKATPHTLVHWLRAEELRITRIATDRRDAEAVVATAAGAAVAIAPVGPPAPMVSSLPPQFSVEDRAELQMLAAAVQTGLRAVGCLAGPITAQWGDRSRLAAERFAATARVPVETAYPTEALLLALASADRRVCVSAVDLAPGRAECACAHVPICTGSWTRLSCAEVRALCRAPDPRSSTASACAAISDLGG